MLPNNSSLTRIWGMVMRYYYVYRRSFMRYLAYAYWPIIDILLWGLVQEFFFAQSDLAMNALGSILAATILWNFLTRSYTLFNMCFLEEYWVRSLATIYTAPLRPYEHFLSIGIFGTLVTTVTMAGISFLAWGLYAFNVSDLGWSLVWLSLNLALFGWVFAIFIFGIMLRYGVSAEFVAWTSIFTIMPLSGVYYPVEILPDFLEPIANILPATLIFTGMREVLTQGHFDVSLSLDALWLNLFYGLLGFWFFNRSMKYALRHGTIMNIGAW